MEPVDPEQSDAVFTYGDPYIGTASMTLIQDNPDYEANGTLPGDNETADLYAFRTMLISDITLKGAATLDLFVENFASSRWNFYTERPENYDPEIWGEEVIIDCTARLEVRHITGDAFRHYRGMKLQAEGLGFFAEPAPIPSNVENGYGCFSLQSTYGVELLSYRLYYYAGRYYYDPHPTPPRAE
jgi:hypothetical protein